MADTIRTEADLLANSFQDGQANNSISAQDMRDLVASTRYLQPVGWEFIFDNVYTSGSPLTCVDGVPQKITITTNPAEELRYPSTFPDIWDKTNNKIAPLALNAFGIIRLSCLGSYTGGTVPHLDVWLDVGSDPMVPAGGGTASNVIYQDSPNFAKAAGEPQAFNFVVPLFSGSDFQTNGGQILIQAHGANVDLYQFTLTSAAIFIPNPAGEG